MSQTASLSRKERERRSRREAMLEAAQAVFAERGYQEATLEEIAERAEFGKGTLYNYFEDGKEELLFAVLAHIYDELEAMTEDLLQSDDAEEVDVRTLFERYIRAIIVHFLDEREGFALLIKEAQRLAFADDAEKVAYFRRQNDRIIRHMVPPIERAVENGTLRDFNPTSIAHTIMGNVNGCLMHVCLEGENAACEADKPRDPDRLAEFLTTMLFDGLCTDRA